MTIVPLLETELRQKCTNGEKAAVCAPADEVKVHVERVLADAVEDRVNSAVDALLFVAQHQFSAQEGRKRSGRTPPVIL